MKNIITLILLYPITLMAQFPGAANTAGTDAIFKDSSIIVNWATQVISFNPGKQDTAVVSSIDASFGTADEALFAAEGTSADIVSLGDGGQITLSFEHPIMNGTGPDFAVFENGFSHTFLELGHVEVSTNGVNFVRFPSTSNVDASVQTGGFGSTDPTLINNLAGKYIQGYGTPFDLEELTDSTDINVDSINFVRIIDVVGSIDPAYGSVDADGDIINDPYPTAFESGGFDLDGIAVIHENRADAGFIDNSLSFSVYPNPTNNEVFVNAENVKSIQLFSITGALITSIQNETSISFLDLALESGVYIIQVTSESGCIGNQRILYQY